MNRYLLHHKLTLIKHITQQHIILNVWQQKQETYSAAGVGSLNPGQVLHVGVEHIHLLNQAGQGGLSSLTNLLVDLLALEKRRAMERIGSIVQRPQGSGVVHILQVFMTSPRCSPERSRCTGRRW